MVLSDRTIRRLLEDGQIGIDPFDDELVRRRRGPRSGRAEALR
jgi:deoxycytidine triphosphate deaminase